MHVQLQYMPQSGYIKAVIKKQLKRKKLKPYPQPSRSEILANQEREEIGGKGESGIMERCLGRWVSSLGYKHINNVALLVNRA